VFYRDVEEAVYLVSVRRFGRVVVEPLGWYGEDGEPQPVP